MAVFVSGRMVTVDQTGQLIELASDIRCVKVIGAKIYACSTTEISVYEFGS